MKKLSFIMTILVVVVLSAFMLTACTESLKQKPFDTNFSETVASNGGMAVVYGDYLYFINGYAGETADNTFGSVVKGAIARVALKGGKPDGEAQIIVPKNVYGTDTKYGGIYIVNNYIYYATTNVEKDGSGKPKTGEGVIMRTKVDGTDTKEVKKFHGHDFVFRVVGDKLTYVHDNVIKFINLNDKKFGETEAVEKVSSYVMDDNYIYYVYSNPNLANDTLIGVYSLADGTAKQILGGNRHQGPEGRTYTLTVLNAIDEGNNIKLFYTRTDSGDNAPEEGVYACTFAKADFAYSKDNDYKYTNKIASFNYTRFDKIGPYYVGLSSERFDVYDGQGNKIPDINGEKAQMSINVGNTVTVFEVEETTDGVYMWYSESSVLNRLRILKKEGSEYVYVEENAVKVFNGSANTSYVGYERIGNVIYYLNSNISNNAYYYEIPEGYAKGDGTTTGKILGKIIEADVIAAF